MLPLTTNTENLQLHLCYPYQLNVFLKKTSTFYFSLKKNLTPHNKPKPLERKNEWNQTDVCLLLKVKMPLTEPENMITESLTAWQSRERHVYGGADRWPWQIGPICWRLYGFPYGAVGKIRWRSKRCYTSSIVCGARQGKVFTCNISRYGVGFHYTPVDILYTHEARQLFTSYSSFGIYNSNYLCNF